MELNLDWLIPVFDALGKLSVWHLLILSVVVLFSLLLFHGKNQPKRFIELNKINERTFAQWLDFVDGVLVQVANVSIEKARKIIFDKYEADQNVCSECRSPLHIPEPDAQIGFFSVRLREIMLTGVVKNKLKLAYRQNGFLEMSKEEYRQYLVDKSHALLNESRSALAESYHLFPYLIGTDEQRCTQKEIFPFVERVFEKAKQLKEEKIEHEKKLYQETSLLFFMSKVKIRIGDGK